MQATIEPANSAAEIQYTSCDTAPTFHWAVGVSPLYRRTNHRNIGAFLAHMHAYRLHALAVVEFIEIPLFLMRLFLS